jgi:hypothetical protein
VTVRKGLALAVVVVAPALAGCTQTSHSPSADRPAWPQQVGEFFDAHGPVALPTRLPQGLAEAQPVTLDGQPAVTFAVPDEPLVTVCSGDLPRCRSALGTSREVRSGRADGRAFVVALGGREDPGAEPTLSAAGRSFWADVALTTSRPSWARAVVDH